MDLEAAEVNVALVAVDAFMGTFPGVETLVQLQVHKLGEFGWAQLALVRLLSRVEPQVGFEIAGAAEPLVTNLMGGGRETVSEWEGILCLNHRHLGRDSRMKLRLFISSHFLTGGKKKSPPVLFKYC